jgi:hypothetical protein
MRLTRAALAFCVLALLASCSSPAPSPPGVVATLTCCGDADIRDYTVGETVTLHWTVTSGRYPSDVELTALLVGRYGGSDELKSMQGTGVVTYASQPLRPVGNVLGDDVVSLIPLPPTAAPGLYNLEWAVTEPDGSFRGASVLRVVPA